MIESNNSHRCHHLVDKNENQIITKMVEDNKLICLSDSFCDHRIPIDMNTIIYRKIDCPYTNNINLCPTIIREKEQYQK